MKQLCLLFLLFALPVYAEDSGTASAPLVHSTGNTKTVCASGCDYTDIQSCVNGGTYPPVSGQGRTCQVKDKATPYQLSNTASNIAVVTIAPTQACTQADPCSIEAYPGSHPIIDVRGNTTEWLTLSKQNPIYLGPVSGTTQWNAWWIIDGLELRGGEYGIRVSFANHLTIRNNKIHHNQFDGIHTDQVSDMYIAWNEIYNNGTDAQACPFDSGGGACSGAVAEPAQACTSSTTATQCKCLNNGGAIGGCHASFHCHGMYLSQFYSPNYVTINNITVRGNYIHNHNGQCTGLGDSTSTTSGNHLIENNLCVDNQIGIQMHGSAKGTIRNNTIVYNTPGDLPYTVGNVSRYYYAMGQWSTFGSTPNTWYNNIIYNRATSYNTWPLYMMQSTGGTDLSKYNGDYNDFFTPANTSFNDNGVIKTNFNAQWLGLIPANQDIHSLGASGGVITPVDPLFLLNYTDFHPKSDGSSPTKDAGYNTSCANLDKDQKARPNTATNLCDIGAYEWYTNTPPVSHIDKVCWTDNSSVPNDNVTPTNCLTTLIKGTTYRRWVRFYCTDCGNLSDVNTIRYALQASGYSLGSTSLCNQGSDVLPYAANLMKVSNVYNLLGTGGTAPIQAFLTDGVNTGTLIGNTNQTIGTTGGYVDSDGSNGWYKDTGDITISVTSHWAGLRIKIDASFTNGLATDRACVTGVNPSVSAEYTQSTVTVQQSATPDPPTVLFDRWGTDTIAGCKNGVSPQLMRGSAIALRVSAAANSPNTLSSLTYRCTLGCTTDTTAITSGTPFTPTLVNGDNTLLVTATDSGNQITTTTCNIRLQPFTLFSIGQ